MSRIGDFIAFQACVALIKERGMEKLLEEVYEECKAELEKPLELMQNPVRRLYEPFSVEELNEKMISILRPDGVTTPIDIVYQSIEGLHQAIPNHPGDWYFSGHYPTPGGMRMINRAYIDYYNRSL